MFLMSEVPLQGESLQSSARRHQEAIVALACPPQPALGLTRNLKPQCLDSFGGHNRNHVSGHTELETNPT